MVSKSRFDALADRSVCTSVKMDCRKYFQLLGPEVHFDLIIHCAAVVGGRLTIDNDPIAVATDLAIDADFFQWCVKLKHKPKRIVYFSSSAVYPIELQSRSLHTALAEPMLNLDATRIGQPDASYGWSKLMGELLARYAAKKYGLPVAVYRPFSGYGEDQDFTYPFPSIVQRVGRGDNPVTIWGAGDQIRDFIHIDDVVECVLHTMDRVEPGTALNIGTGQPTSFYDLVMLARTVLGKDSTKIMLDKSKPEGVFYRVSDPYNMLKLYEPKISLAAGIRRVHDYQKANGLLDSGLVSA
jgi:GDP-L-fucose synthase